MLPSSNEAQRAEAWCAATIDSRYAQRLLPRLTAKALRPVPL